MIIDHLLRTNGGQHMKILPWLTNTEDVIGTADELGKDCKKLDKLYDHCWQIAVKVGYLPKNSVFNITRPTVVRLRCSDTHYDLLGRHFEVKVVIAPRKLSSEEYYKHAVEEDLS